DLEVPFPAPFFLIMPECQVDVTRWLEAVGQQSFDGFEKSECADLHIECTTAPDEAIGDLPRERRVRPLRLRLFLDGHDIKVGHQEDRLPSGVGAFPAVEQALASMDLALEMQVNERERRLQD